MSNETKRRQFIKNSLTVAGSLTAAGLSAGTLAASPEEKRYVINQPDITAIEVAGTDSLFPVRRIYCLGRNFSAHAVEMGDDPDEKPPFYFMKPTDAVYAADQDFPYPSKSDRVGFEIELVIALKSGGKNIAEADALKHIYGYGVGLDMTRRDLQDIAKENSRPWEGGKSFDQSAPCSPIHPVEKTGHPQENRIWLSVNGEVKQDSSTALMRWNIAESINILSQYFELKEGDLIFAGTPEGVGLINKGDVIRAGVEGIADIEVKII